MRRSRIPISWALAVSLLRWRIALRSRPSKESRWRIMESVNRVNSEPARPVTPQLPNGPASAVDQLKSTTARVRSAWFPPRWTLHSPPILAGFTILTAFLVWGLLRTLPIARHTTDFPLPGAENSSKLKEERPREPVEQTRSSVLWNGTDRPAEAVPAVATSTMTPPALLPTDAEAPKFELSSE